MKTSKRHPAVFGLVLASLVFALLLAEIFVRMFYPHCRDHVMPQGLLKMDSHLGWRLNPGRTGLHRTRYFETRYSVNSLGFRDGPRSVGKREDAYRILLYGDSLVFGWGVPGDRRFSSIIEKRASGLEVWNLGVPGYGLDQEIIYYQREAKRLEPDEVVFFVSRDTVERSDYSYIYKKYKPIFTEDESGALSPVFVAEPRRALAAVLYKFMGPLYLPKFLELRLMARGYEPESPAREAESRAKERRGFVRKLLQVAGDAAELKGHRMTVLAWLPGRGKMGLDDFCARSGIGFWEIDIDPETSGLVLGERDRHWNPEANRLIAGQLLPLMRGRGAGP